MPPEKKKILIIEDSQSSRYLYKTVFSNERNYHLLLSSNLKEGFELYQKTQPDLIVLDLHLPDGTGLDFLKKIREKGSAAKVIIISAIKESNVIVESARLGIDYYLIKPVDINILLKKVRELLPESAGDV
jgi:DNA-binding response OmpR family regulator